MGMFDDYRRMRKAGKQAEAAMGRPTTTLGRLTNLPNDMRAAADHAEWVASQSAGPTDELAGGIAGTAVIHAHRSTGAMSGFDPVSELDLEVRLPGRETYPVTATIRIPYTQLVKVTVGRELTIRVDPEDRARIAVDW